MITRFTTALTQRALDRRQPPPALVQRIATWHAPTRRMLDDLQAVDRALHTTATSKLPSLQENPGKNPGEGAGEGAPELTPTSPNANALPPPPPPDPPPAWWQRPAAPLAGAALAAILALAALGTWLATQPTTHPPNTPSIQPPTLHADADADTQERSDEASGLPGTPGTPGRPNTHTPKTASLRTFTWNPPRAFSLPRWPAAAALAAPVSSDAFAQSVHRLGSELEKPLRQEWSRLVRDVSGVANSFQSAWSTPAQPQPNPAPNQSRRPQPPTHQA